MLCAWAIKSLDFWGMWDRDNDRHLYCKVIGVRAIAMIEQILGFCAIQFDSVWWLGVFLRGRNAYESMQNCLCQGLISATHVSMGMVANVSLSILKQGRVEWTDEVLLVVCCQSEVLMFEWKVNERRKENYFRRISNSSGSSIVVRWARASGRGAGPSFVVLSCKCTHYDNNNKFWYAGLECIDHSNVSGHPPNLIVRAQRSSFKWSTEYLYCHHCDGSRKMELCTCWTDGAFDCL